jgi:hypothetical protein
MKAKLRVVAAVDRSAFVASGTPVSVLRPAIAVVLVFSAATLFSERELGNRLLQER